MRIIKVLTNKDAKHFNKEAPKYEVVIAGFFMVNCPACDAFKPEWNNFVKSCEHIQKREDNTNTKRKHKDTLGKHEKNT